MHPSGRLREARGEGNSDGVRECLRLTSRLSVSLYLSGNRRAMHHVTLIDDLFLHAIKSLRVMKINDSAIR